MNLQYIEEFIELAELQSYGDVAAKLNISDSSLSRHIKALEEDVGVALFDRTSRSVKLNAYGQVFLPYAREFALLRERSLRELEDAKKRSRNTLRVGTHYYIDDLLARFHLHVPDISIPRIGNVSSTGELLDLLRLGMCEIAFVNEPIDAGDEFVSIPYLTDHYVVILPAAHPFAKRPSLQLHELANEDFISFKTGTPGDARIRRLCHDAGFEPRIVFDGEVASKVAEFVNQGIGLSIVLKKSLQQTAPIGLCLVDIEPRVPVYVSLCYRRHAPLSAAAERFIEFVTVLWPTLQPSNPLGKGEA